ncbi:WG repeat-containing protein [Mucilaginibacter terrae]|uniref:WG repeat-containing protein n=1 Tax=Mucilaginibacter terrae TaxID=1955052 RepID=UPI0036381E2C
MLQFYSNAKASSLTLLLVCLLNISFCVAQNPVGKTIDQLYSQAKLIDATEYDEFYQGYAIIRKGEEFSLIFQDGRTVIPFGKYKFNNLQGFKIDVERCGFRNGMCVVRDPVTEKYGYINRNLELVVPCTLIDVKPFMADGYAWAKRLDAKGKEQEIFIDKKGIKYIAKGQPSYSKFQLDCYPVLTADGYNTFYAKNGTLLFKTKRQFDYAKGFSDGLIKVDTNDRMSGSKSGFMDKKGRLVIPYQFKGRVYEFHEGLALVEPPVSDAFKYAYINKKGQIVIRLNSSSEFEDLNIDKGNFEQGYTIGSSRKGNVMIDTLGNMTLIADKIRYNQFNQAFFSRFNAVEIQKDNIKYKNGQFKFYATMSFKMPDTLITGGLNGGRKIIRMETYTFTGQGIASSNGQISILPIYKEINFPEINSTLAKASYVMNLSKNVKVEANGYADFHSENYYNQFFQFIIPNKN